MSTKTQATRLARQKRSIYWAPIDTGGSAGCAPGLVAAAAEARLSKLSAHQQHTPRSLRPTLSSFSASRRRPRSSESRRRAHQMSGLVFLMSESPEVGPRHRHLSLRRKRFWRKWRKLPNIFPLRVLRLSVFLNDTTIYEQKHNVML